MMVMAVDRNIHDAFECTNPAPALSTQKKFGFREWLFIHMGLGRRPRLNARLWLNH
jgi:hypothetical protein